MEIKTLAYLNSKAWYRFIKVLFIIGFLIVVAGFNFIVFSQGVKRIDQNNTIIQCNTQNKAVFSQQSIGISLDSQYFTGGQFDYEKYFKGYNDYAITAILTKCAPKTVAGFGSNTNPAINDIYDLQKSQEIKKAQGLEGNNNLTTDQINALNADYSTYQQETKFMVGNGKTQYLDFSFHLFDITPAYTYNPFLEWFLIGNFIILLVFEVIRRIFYYIVLGTLRPKRHN